MPSLLAASPLRFVWPYIQIARIDHWFKNLFMLVGMLLTFSYRPEFFTLSTLPILSLAVLATCIVASSNYTINELIDAPLDRLHPVKKNRPVARGEVKAQAAVAQWLLLGALGVTFGCTINKAFGLSLLLLWVMGCVYNIPPLRSKDIPYLDVLSESVNNPIRLLLGWYVVIPDRFPPLSLLLAYWMVGAFFMATKRYAEYRLIGDTERAASYRKSFRYYDEDRLLVSMFFYTAACALCSGIFIVRYKLELILSIPFLAGCFGYYMKLGLKPDSPVQNPERLYKERGFVIYMILTTTTCILLMFTEIPVLYKLFNVTPSSLGPLWKIGWR